ncbi:LysR family transcriptional regulator [Persicobacter diffluens]|uniref:LysR family transcriptional regulator n=1 Tax=Persicobacter diffluens TaxID=981 RepID=A0AAN4W2G2_9BACT|nr:LysR family transcriptional regulator [Persicobacter diffluens]
MVNLEWYRTFKTIYEKGSLTAAAESLFISQPGVSLHLSSLESYVGYKLFERGGRKLLPTERGIQLYHALIEPIQKLEEVEKKYQKSTEKDTPTISLGMCFETFQITLEEYLHTLPFNVILEFGGYHSLLQKLEKGVVDIVVTAKKLETRGIVHEPFSQEQIILVGSKDIQVEMLQELARKDEKGFMEFLKQQTWYGPTGENEHLQRFWMQNFGQHPDFRPNYIVPNFNSIIRCLTVGSGMAIIPDFLCKQEIAAGKIQLLWKGYQPLVNTLYFVKRKKTIFEREVQTIRDIFEKNSAPLTLKE